MLLVGVLVVSSCCLGLKLEEWNASWNFSLGDSVYHGVQFDDLDNLTVYFSLNENNNLSNYPKNEYCHNFVSYSCDNYSHSVCHEMVRIDYPVIGYVFNHSNNVCKRFTRLRNVSGLSVSIEDPTYDIQFVSQNDGEFVGNNLV